MLTRRSFFSTIAAMAGIGGAAAIAKPAASRFGPEWITEHANEIIVTISVDSSRFTAALKRTTEYISTLDPPLTVDELPALLEGLPPIILLSNGKEFSRVYFPL